MQRSESILVWAVSVVVVVIVGVAVVFGRNDEPAGKPGANGLGPNAPGGELGKGAASNPDRPASLLDSLRDRNAADPAAGPPVAEQPGGGTTLVGDATTPPVADDAEAALRARATNVRAVLGEFRLEGQPDGSRYRVVTVRARDTFGALVQRWTGSTSRTDDVRALNEGVVPENVRVGEELWFPWVDDEVLLDAHASRTGGLARASESSREAEPRPVEGSPLAGNTSLAAPRPDSGEWRTVKQGESLWRIASDAVGQRRAQEFIDQLLRLNPSIQDPGHVRAGDRILMPKR